VESYNIAVFVINEHMNRKRSRSVKQTFLFPHTISFSRLLNHLRRNILRQTVTYTHTPGANHLPRPPTPICKTVDLVPGIEFGKWSSDALV
jgi:hypothetical protein